MNKTTYRDIAENTAVYKFEGLKQPNEDYPQQNVRIATIDDTWKLFKNLWKPGMRKRGANLIKKYLVEDHGWNPEDFTIDIIEPWSLAAENWVYVNWDDKFFKQ